MAQPMDKKGAVWMPSPAQPSSVPSRHPCPPAAQCPQYLGEAGRGTQIQPLLGISLCHESKQRPERSTAIPVHKEKPPHQKGAATAKASPQSHPMLQILSAEPATASSREQGCTRVLCCMALWGRNSLRPVKVVSYMHQARVLWLCKEPVRAMNHHIKQMNVNLCSERVSNTVAQAGCGRAPV